MIKPTQLNDEEFKVACTKVQDTLRSIFGQAPNFRDVLEVMNTVVISISLTLLANKRIRDPEIFEKNKEELIRMFAFMWDKYSELYVNNYEEFEKLVQQDKEIIKKLEEEFPEVVKDESKKEAIELFARMGIDISKLKH